MRLYGHNLAVSRKAGTDKQARPEKCLCTRAGAGGVLLPGSGCQRPLARRVPADEAGTSTHCEVDLAAAHDVIQEGVDPVNLPEKPCISQKQRWVKPASSCQPSSVPDSGRQIAARQAGAQRGGVERLTRRGLGCRNPLEGRRG